MVFGHFPLVLKLSAKRLRMVNLVGVGMLVGTAFIVIVPEGVHTIYAAEQATSAPVFEPLRMADGRLEPHGHIAPQASPDPAQPAHAGHRKDQADQRTVDTAIAAALNQFTAGRTSRTARRAVGPNADAIPVQGSHQQVTGALSRKLLELEHDASAMHASPSGSSSPAAAASGSHDHVHHHDADHPQHGSHHHAGEHDPPGTPVGRVMPRAGADAVQAELITAGLPGGSSAAGLSSDVGDASLKSHISDDHPAADVTSSHEPVCPSPATPTAAKGSAYIGAALVLGFILQLLVEKLVGGADHSHGHSHTRESAGCTGERSETQAEAGHHACGDDHSHDHSHDQHAGVGVVAFEDHSQCVHSAIEMTASPLRARDSGPRLVVGAESMSVAASGAPSVPIAASTDFRGGAGLPVTVAMTPAVLRSSGQDMAGAASVSFSLGKDLQRDVQIVAVTSRAHGDHFPYDSAHTMAPPSSDRPNQGTVSATIGLLVHAAVDGVALGAASFSGSSSLEIIVFLAIAIHKAPHAFGLASYLLEAGKQRRYGASQSHSAVFMLQ